MDEVFYKKLLDTFKVEAGEHLEMISSGLIEFEKATDQKKIELAETIYRETHSLKGAADSVNLVDIKSVCQAMESVLAAIKRQEIGMTPQILDALNQGVDIITRLLTAGSEQTAFKNGGVKSIVQRFNKILKGEVNGGGDPVETSSPEMTVPQSPTPVMTDTVRISTEKLKALLFKAEELLAARLLVGRHASELEKIGPEFSVWEKEWGKVRRGVRGLQQMIEKRKKEDPGKKTDSQLASILRFTDWNYNYMRSLGSRLKVLTKCAEDDHRSIGRMVNVLLEDMKKTLMLPFSSLLAVFPKIVKDIARAQGKEVDLVIQGGDIEIDKRILDEMKDPLIHLVRNCVDHGIEKPKDREQKNKPPCGKITIAVSQKDQSTIEIVISDDGKGIDAGKVKSAAVKLGIVSQQEADDLDEHQSLSLIFQSGTSTSAIVTDISGRGLGLAIVREKAGNLGGVVKLETVPEVGTTFRILLPSTLATFRGVLVEERGQCYVFPTTMVERVVRVRMSDVQTVENRETIKLDEQPVSLVSLGDVLGITERAPVGDNREYVFAVVLSDGKKPIAFSVDRVLSEQEVLVKNLSANLSRLRNVSSTTVLVTGNAVPILNVPDLMKSAVKVVPSADRRAVAEEEMESERKTILVAEDSITARTLLVNIIETDGYDVQVAVNGLDAYNKLKVDHFDLLVSDVDMPEMGGFDLTKRIRSDKQLAELPVVLVTALDSREDMERGIEVGADAYIVKSSFDQSNLLEIIRRLI